MITSAWKTIICSSVSVASGGLVNEMVLGNNLLSENADEKGFKEGSWLGTFKFSC